MNGMLLLLCPPTITSTGLEVAPWGTGTIISFSVQSEGDAGTCPKRTLELPRVGPKFDPEMVTGAPMDPAAGLSAVIVGNSVNVGPVVETPLTVTVMFPDVAPTGTATYPSEQSHSFVNSGSVLQLMHE